MNNSLRLLICYDYFFPGYKAGGPIQSLVNLILTLSDNCQIFVITSALDLNVRTPYKVNFNQWNNVTVAANAKPISVWYGYNGHPDVSDYKSIFDYVKPDVFYINGIFSFRFFLIPLFVIRSFKEIRIVICPRGMLQPGALQNGKLKKSLYLNFIKILGFLKKVVWHATSEEEQQDIRQHFKTAKIYQAPNIPKLPVTQIVQSSKQAEQLNLVYLSLITEKKNLHLLLSALQQTTGVSLDIFGPIKDEKYWMKCKNLIDSMPGYVRYMGEAIPEDVQSVLYKYDALALITKGENFGHAIYESLSVGRPVLTSNHTPWKNLKSIKAGWNISLERQEIKDIIESIRLLSKEEHQVYCEGAYKLAKNYYDSIDAKNAYCRLFQEVT